MAKLVRYCSLLLLSFCSTVTIAAQMSVVQTAQTIQWMTEDYPPYNYPEQDTVSGIATDLLRSLYDELGISFPEQNLQLLPWPRAYSNLLSIDNTCLFSTTYTQERQTLFKFFGPITQVKISVIARLSSPITLTDMTELSKLRVGVVREDIGHQILLQQQIEPEAFVYLKTGYELVKMLIHNRVDVIVYGEHIANTQFEKAGVNAKQYKTLLVLKESELGFACNNHVPTSFITEMQNALDRVRAKQRAQQAAEAP
jgi:polar amino acid transport system substrate-binding protein